MIENKNPYSNFHELNLDFVLHYLKNMFGGRPGDVLKKDSSTDMAFSWGRLNAQDVGALPDTYTPPVESVNGKTGAVELSARDVGALPNNYAPPVESVNGKTGAVELSALDVGALPDNYAPPVISVNGKIGAVRLNASDVFALPSTYTPPVESVNGKTGNVELSASDVGAIPATTPVATMQDLINLLPVVSMDSVGIANIKDGANNVPVENLIVDITPLQEGSGDPSPENVRPISGWNGVTLYHRGSNVLKLTDGNYSINGVTTTITNGVIHLSGTPSRNGGRNIRLSEPFTLEPGTYLFENPSNAGINFCLSRQNGGSLFKAGNTAPFTISNAEVVHFGINLNAETLYDDYVIPQIIVGNTPVEAAPAIVNDIVILWQAEAGTVYGGTLDVLSGTLRARPYYAAYAGEPIVGPWLSSMDVYSAGATPTTGAQVVDMGGAETVYHLSPHEVRTMLVVNNLWADTGPISVTYRADIQKYIDGRVL